MQPQEYLNLVRQGRPPLPPPFVNGLCGRITRGRTDADFERLSDDPNRLAVFLTDAAGLAKLLRQRSHYDMLVTVGHHPDHIRSKLTTTPPHRYQMVVFPDRQAVAGTWEGVLQLAAQVYPDLSDDLRRHSLALSAPALFRDGRTEAFDCYEKAAGFRFADADSPTDPRYMTHAAYLKSARGPVDLRRLLYHTLHLRELYAGDGYTYDEHGQRQVREYLIRNVRVADIPGVQVADLNVCLP